jgi:hypothetical protein
MQFPILRGERFDDIVHDYWKCCEAHHPCLSQRRCRWYFDNKVCRTETCDLTPTMYRTLKDRSEVIRSSCIAR